MPKTTKRERWLRDAPKRGTLALQALGRVEDMAAMSYEWTQEEVDELVFRLGAGVDAIKEAFEPKAVDKTARQFELPEKLPAPKIYPGGGITYTRGSVALPSGIEVEPPPDDAVEHATENDEHLYPRNEEIES